MKMKRRTFLKGLFVGAVAAVVPVSKIAGEAVEQVTASKIAQDTITRVDPAKGESFSAFLQASFRESKKSRGGYFVPAPFAKAILEEAARPGPIFTTGGHEVWTSFKMDPEEMLSLRNGTWRLG